MKTLIAISILSTIVTTTTTTAFAQTEGADSPDTTEADPAPEVAHEPPSEDDVATAQLPWTVTEHPAEQPTEQPEAEQHDDGWRPPPGRRLLHGFRIGYNYIMNYDEPTRSDGSSVKDYVGLKTPHSMLLGYEAFYRIIGHDWLNILVVGNVTVAGLEQSKFIPAASGLIGAEFAESFQLGVGVNLTPDPEGPSHMIAAAGWTPQVGSLQTPVHFYFVPDTNTNHRMGLTIGVTW